MSGRSVLHPGDMLVVAGGAVTCLGLSSASTCAAVRACLSNFDETDFVDEIGEPLLGARVDTTQLGFDGDEGAVRGGAERLAAMFVHAARQCAAEAGGMDAARTALLLVGPEATRAGITVEKLQACFNACQAAVGHAFHATSRITQSGNPGLAQALAYARTLLWEGQVDGVLVAGVDCLLNTADVNDALHGNRLLTSQNSDGFIPGEAAACVYLQRADAASPWRGQPVLRVAGIADASEEHTLEDDLPARGLALAAAIEQALRQAAVAAHDIHVRYADVTAESYFYEEASYAWIRLLRERQPAGHKFTTLVGRVGHVGAAMGPLTLVVALDAARKRWAPGPLSLLQLSSAGVPRGAVVVAAQSWPAVLPT